MTKKKSEINRQIATPEFCRWLDTTSFAGCITPGDQWDTEDAWPSPETMRSARKCFAEFAAGNFTAAEAAMHDAQRSFI